MMVDSQARLWWITPADTCSARPAFYRQGNRPEVDLYFSKDVQLIPGTQGLGQPPPNLSTGGTQPASISTYRRTSAGIPQSCRSSWPRPFWPLPSPSGIPPKEQICSCAQRYRTGGQKAHGRQIQGETRVPPSTILSAGATESDSVSIQTLDHSGECPPAATGTASEQEKGLHRQQRGMGLAPWAGGRLEQGPGPFVLAHQRDKSGLCVTEVLVSVTNCTFKFQSPKGGTFLKRQQASACSPWAKLPQRVSDLITNLAGSPGQVTPGPCPCMWHVELGHLLLALTVMSVWFEVNFSLIKTVTIICYAFQGC